MPGTLATPCADSSATVQLLGQQPFSGINRGHVSKRVTRGIFMQPAGCSAGGCPVYSAHSQQSPLEQTHTQCNSERGYHLECYLLILVWQNAAKSWAKCCRYCSKSLCACGLTCFGAVGATAAPDSLKAAGSQMAHNSKLPVTRTGTSSTGTNPTSMPRLELNAVYPCVYLCCVVTRYIHVLFCASRCRKLLQSRIRLFPFNMYL